MFVMSRGMEQGRATPDKSGGRRVGEENIVVFVAQKRFGVLIVRPEKKRPLKAKYTSKTRDCTYLPLSAYWFFFF